VIAFILLLIILNYGFMQIRITSIPLGEIILLIYLLTSNIPLLLNRFFAVVNPTFFFMWWLIGIGGSLFYLNKNGIWALRDATNVIESLYLLVGFSVFSSTKIRRMFVDKMPLFLLIVTVYVSTYPIGNTLRSMSPKIVSGAGTNISLFFYYTNSSLMLMLVVFYLSLVEKPKNIFEKNSSWCVALVILFAVGFFQSRILYIHLVAIFLMIIYLRPQLSKRWFMVGIGMITLLFLIDNFNIKIEGRLGQSLSVEFLFNHMSAILGESSDGLEGAAHGVSQRNMWWMNVYEKWSHSLTTILFGVGYGFPLISFGLADGVAVREPHNSYLSIVARSGLVGLISWLFIHVSLIKVWKRMYLYYKKKGETDVAKFLIILMGYFVLVWLRSIVQDGFEKPFIAIPYYFFWGGILRMYWNEKYLSGRNDRSIL